MKKMLVLTTCILALALGAAAQNQISFAELPLVKLPAPMPSGYYGLNWSNIYYVDPALWSGAGPGYKNGLANQDVAFIGNSACNYLPPSQRRTCDGEISVPSSGGLGGVVSFQALSASVAAGFSPTSFTVLAYNNGKFVGTAFYSIGTRMQTIYFPSSWGLVTELTFQTQGEGDLVFYGLDAQLILQ